MRVVVVQGLTRSWIVQRVMAHACHHGILRRLVFELHRFLPKMFEGEMLTMARYGSVSAARNEVTVVVKRRDVSRHRHDAAADTHLPAVIGLMTVDVLRA